jgi:phosphopantetheine adenylyltransferase/dephospho-CoA kinase
VVPIRDPFGPAIEDPSLEAIVVSEETLRGGQKVNEVREQKGMKALDIEMVPLVGESSKQSNLEEDKVSSSTLRLRKLGTLLRQPEPKPQLPFKRPYLIGMTGGIASGKTRITQELAKLGAGTINCDLVAHEAYVNPGSLAYSEVVTTFGKGILQEKDSTIDRRKLGAIVFGDKEKLNKLNNIVWPATQRLVTQRVEELKSSHEVIVIEAALLLEAKWDSRVHQVWVAIIPEKEAVDRVVKRNGFTSEEAMKRVKTQFSNSDRVKKANVVFCSLWDYQFTDRQVRKAWDMLQKQFMSK